MKETEQKSKKQRDLIILSEKFFIGRLFCLMAESQQEVRNGR